MISRLKLFGSSRGFSFTEMSVVLASVSAIVVMALGGSAVLNKTKNNNVLSQISKFSTAVEKFEKEYNALPGDIADVSSLPNANPGNGNGVIDTEAEAIGFWHHLAIAGLLQGRYDGSSTYTPGKGVPSANIEGGGYKVRLAGTITSGNISEQAIAIELAGYNHLDSNNTLAIITAEDAKSIDEKLDDGNPSKGIVLADGNGTDCINSDGKYNVSMKTASCRLIFIIRGSKNIDMEPVTGSCNALGLTRQKSDPSQTCPDGYEGSIIETCRVNEDNVGSWEVMDSKCEEVKCSDGGLFGDTRRLGCINNMVGSGILQRCNESGVWEIENNDCSVKESSPCQNNGEVRKTQACGLGQEGYLLQTCTDNKWVNTDDSCSPTKCDFKDIGVSGNSGLSCGSDYIGTVKEVCTISGGWEVTSVGSTCTPDYSGSCTAGDTKDIGCPRGKVGKHTLICMDAQAPDTDYWTTLIDTCSPITCDGGESVGSYRVKEGAYCDNGSNGTITEYCNDNGVWETASNNCTSGICNATNDLVGNAYWPATPKNSIAHSDRCNEGYHVIGTAQRRCNADETWGDVIVPCERIVCNAGKAVNSTASTGDDATYPQTFAGEDDIKGQCDTANGYEGSPVADCSIEGIWVNERLSCRKFCPTKTINNATYDKTFSGKTGVNGKCDKGYSGFPTMDCDSDGNWVNQIGACTPDYVPETHCQVAVINNARYPKTPVSTNNITGVCNEGYNGSPLMNCDKSGQWVNERNACVPNIDYDKVTISDMVMWFDAQDGNTVFKNTNCTGKANPGGDRIACWKDKSGNNYHAKQSNTSLRPLYTSKSQGKNGYPTVRFNQNLLYYPYKSYTAGFSLFVMHKENKYQYSGVGSSKYMTLIGSNGDVEEDSVWLTFDASPSRLMLYRGKDKTRYVFGHQYRVGIHNISVVSYDANRISYYRNSSYKGGGTNPATKNKLTQWGPGGIGGWKVGSVFTEIYYGDIGEIVLYDNKLNNQERNTVETYLSDKWGIPLQ